MHQIKIQATDNHFKTNFDKNEILLLSKRILKEENICNYDIGIIFANNNYIIDLNKRFFNKDDTTDVISFNLSNRQIEGEIYINFDIIQEQAEYYSVSFDEEMKRLLIHGILHLAGYEDYSEENRMTMRKQEDYYLI